jgi:hypothetical protein
MPAEGGGGGGGGGGSVVVTYVSIRQHTSAYVITSAYVSIRSTNNRYMCPDTAIHNSAGVAAAVAAVAARARQADAARAECDRQLQLLRDRLTGCCS